MNVEQLVAFVTTYRDRARAILRAQSINSLVARRQGLTADIKAADKKISDTAKRVEEINAGSFAASLTEARTSTKSPEEMKAKVLADLAKDSEAATKQKEELTTELTKLDEEILSASKGGKGYAFSKSEITDLSNQLMREDEGLLLTQIEGEASSDVSSDRAEV